MKSERISRGLALVTCLLLIGCSTTPHSALRELPLRDSAFVRPAVSPSAADLFTLTPSMQAFLRQQLSNEESGFRTRGPQQGLVDALYTKGELRIDYDAAQTRNAAETFAQKSGNCLSLVVMTAAFAKALGLDVHYQQIAVNDTWSRAAGLHLAVGHVNITLGRKPNGLHNERREWDPLTVDFFPPEATTGQRSWSLSERTVIAMYMNNRAAEALVSAQINDAYWWAREAIMVDEQYLPAYNTLGVIYRRSNLNRDAVTAFWHVVTREPNNANALSNLIIALNESGATEEARGLADRLAKLGPYGSYPPFHFLELALNHWGMGEFTLARDALATELKRDPNNDEVHYWLAKVLVKLGETKRAAAHLARAEQSSPTPQRREIYAAKLDWLRAQGPLSH